MSYDEGQFSDYEENLSNKVNAVTFNDTPSYHSDSANDDYDDGNSYDMHDINETNYKKKGNFNTQPSATRVSAYQPSKNLLHKNVNRIYLGPYKPELQNNMLQSGNGEQAKIKDKSDKATCDRVLDRNTMQIINKMFSKGLIDEICGTIATGKEANVYYARSSTGVDMALKIYETTNLTFKARSEYIRGEKRFENNNCQSPFKMVQTWAQKEHRNLIRMRDANLNVPHTIELKSHVLLMTFIGKDGWPAKRLHAINLSQTEACSLYFDCLVMMWKLINVCKLVHADLSEYNLLYHEKKLFVIDVSQSVEHDHPKAFEFMRKDCTNITNFFKKFGVATLSVKELFEFLMDKSVNEKNLEDRLLKLSNAKDGTEMTAEEKIEEEAFKNVFIPRNLSEVTNYENRINTANEEENEESISSNDDDGSSGSEDENESKFINSARPRSESPNSKKARKKAVKEEKAEKRKIKTPKHVKKRREKSKRSSK